MPEVLDSSAASDCNTMSWISEFAHAGDMATTPRLKCQASVNLPSEVQQDLEILAGQEIFIQRINNSTGNPLPTGWTLTSLEDHIDYVLRRRMIQGDDHSKSGFPSEIDDPNPVETQERLQSFASSNNSISNAPRHASSSPAEIPPSSVTALARSSSLSLAESYRHVPYQREVMNKLTLPWVNASSLTTSQPSSKPLSRPSSENSIKESTKQEGHATCAAVQGAVEPAADPSRTGSQSARPKPYTRKKPGEHEPDFVLVREPGHCDQVCQWVIETDQLGNALTICGETFTSNEGAKVHLQSHRNVDNVHINDDGSEFEAAGNRKIRCGWLGCEKMMQSKFFSRHAQAIHLELKILCLRCGDTVKRVDEEKRHRAVQCERTRLRNKCITPCALKESLTKYHVSLPTKETTTVFTQRQS
ncbi:hypothetical protein EV368DRAFT_83704 [Lentinula lateritia]|uniref:Uncharacterized protein n=1 Tax=Lentinula aff. lateritia TaxID=2804960 RepID=A0ACC1TZ19_9AGAR|nr:hypothetical protein F5876DRAFT_77397 [Lentinula aff. lateritia]KAJ3851288.1 hypothetical protein EV368DRAFT_83704 [Lentinula lateritia]